MAANLLTSVNAFEARKKQFDDLRQNFAQDVFDFKAANDFSKVSFKIGGVDGVRFVLIYDAFDGVRPKENGVKVASENNDEMSSEKWDALYDDSVCHALLKIFQ